MSRVGQIVKISKCRVSSYNEFLPKIGYIGLNTKPWVLHSQRLWHGNISE